MTDIIGFKKITKLNVGNKKIFLLGEMHIKNIYDYLTNEFKSTNPEKQIIGITSFMELLLKDNSNQKVHVFLEGPGEFHKVNFLDSLGQYNHIDAFSNDVGHMCDKYIYGQYKNYIETIQDKYPIKEHIKQIDEPVKNNIIAMSNFHKNINFHLIDYRGPDLFKFSSSNKKFTEILWGDLKENEGVFQNQQYMIDKKLIEVSDSKYITVFGKMYNLLSESSKKLIENFVSSNNTLGSSYGQSIMDTVALTKLLYYLSNSYRLDSSGIDEAATIIIYGGDAHTETYYSFLNNILKINHDIRLEDTITPLFNDNYIANVNLSDLLSGDYNLYIKNISSRYANDAINMKYEYDDLDQAFLSIFCDSKSIDVIDFKNKIEETQKLFIPFIDKINGEIKSSDKLDVTKKSFGYTVGAGDELENKNLFFVTFLMANIFDMIELSYCQKSTYNFIEAVKYIEENRNLFTSTIGNLEKYDKKIKNSSDFFKVPNDSFTFNDSSSLVETKEVSLYSVLAQLKTIIGGGANFAELEAIEFDEFTKSTEFIQKYVEYLSKKKMQAPYTFVNPVTSIKVFGGAMAGGAAILIILLLILLIVDYLFNTQLCCSEFADKLIEGFSGVATS